MEKILEKLYEYLVTYGLQIIAALAILIVGRWVAKLTTRGITRAMVRADADRTLTKFVENVSYFAMLFLVIIAAIAKIGVPTVQFIAVIGATGLAVGLALQGSMSNFASGLLLIVFRPFKVGDFVEVGGTKGTVREIQIYATVLDSLDNVRITIPNAQITNTTISNYDANDTRRIDLKIGVSYDDDLKKARQVIDSVIASDPRILRTPAPEIAVSELADSSVNFVVRPWVKPADYWDVYYDTTAKLKVALEANGLTIPFPQRDINIRTVDQKTTIRT